jgi:hypothetical protein
MRESHWGGLIEIGFCSNPDGERRSTFEAYIVPDDFAELAKLMLKADPQAAIRAFGAALQDVSVQAVENSGEKAA